MRLAIHHVTTYRYGGPVALALQRLRLGPAAGPVHVVSWQVALEGAGEEATFTDGHGNLTRLVSALDGASGVTITVAGEVETLREDGVVGPHSGAPLWLYARTTPLTDPGEGVRSLAAGLAADDPLAALHALTRRTRETIEYRVGSTDAATSAEEAIGRGAGVCQDHAHAFCAAARLLGLPARYVSGYLRMDDRDEQEATHAWAEAHVPNIGWVGFDPANGHSPDGRYVPIARGLDYRDAAPVTGLVRGGPSGERNGELSVSLAVIERQVDQQQQSQQ